MENGRELFKPWIAERGQAYFECGHMVELEEEGFVVRLKQITAPDHWSMIFEKLLKKHPIHPNGCV